MKITIARPIASQIEVGATVVQVVQSGVGVQGPKGDPGLDGIDGVDGADGADGVAGGFITDPLNCPLSISVSNLVYISGSNAVDLNDQSSASTCDTFGVVVEKPTGTTAKIQLFGLANVFSGLSPGTRYFAGSSGAITSTPPTSGVLQVVGRAVTDTILNVSIQPRILM